MVYKDLDKIDCAFQLAEILAIQVFLNRAIYNLFCTDVDGALQRYSPKRV